MSMPVHILGPLEALERCLLLGSFHLGSLAQGALCPEGRASFGLCGSAFALLDARVRPYKAYNLRVHEGEAPLPHRLFPRSRMVSGSLGNSSPCHSAWRMAWAKWRRELLFSKSGRAHFLSPTRNVRCSNPLFRLQTARRPVFCRRMQTDGHLSVFVPHSTQPCVRRL